jgi:hypothetical protein
MVFAARPCCSVPCESVSQFSELLNRAVATFPNRSAFAKAMGLNASRLSRALNTGDFPFNVANCLRLAQVSGESPSVVLRAAGKGDIADLIEALYGRDRNELLSAEERALLDQWRRLDPNARAGLHALLGSRFRSSGVQKTRKGSDRIGESARGGATQADTGAGKEFVEPRTIPQTNGQATGIPGAQRAREGKEAAAIDRLTRAAEQADAVGRAARPPRAAGQHAATPRARATARGARAGKHRR